MMTNQKSTMSLVTHSAMGGPQDDEVHGRGKLLARDRNKNPWPSECSEEGAHNFQMEHNEFISDDEYQEDPSELNRLIGIQRLSTGQPSELAPSMFARDQTRGPSFAETLLGYVSSKAARSKTTSFAYSTSEAARGHQAQSGASMLPPPPTLAHHRSHLSSILKHLLLILIFILLIVCSLKVLFKLHSLVRVRELKTIATIDDLRMYKQNLLKEIDGMLDEAHRKQLQDEQMSRWLVSGSKCHIPVLEPWDKSIRSYVRRKQPLNCSEVLDDESDSKGLTAKLNTTTSSLSYVKDNKLFFVREALEQGALEGRCCYRILTRSMDSDDKIEVENDCVPVSANGLEVNKTLIRVFCMAPLNYQNVHAFIVSNKEEEEALKRVAHERLNQDDYYNVLMVGVDTISRLNAQRQLKKTLKLLTGDLYHTLDFTGYNKVGENTFPNLIPLLTGLRPNQLPETECWMVKNYTDEGERGDEYLDNCKYLWNFYQQIGYSTYFSEDWPAASTFNYLKWGFKNEPTTYYGRPFALARADLEFPKFKSTGCALCQLDRPIVQVDLENLQTFIRQRSNQPYFAFHWINCPQHDDLNGASQADALLADFFKRVQPITQAQRTFVIFFSDHGYRWNNFVSTRIGHYESSLPLLTIAAPESFIKRHPDLYQNLKDHQHALLTPFDMFKTLIAVKDLSSSRKKSTGTKKSPQKRQAMVPMIPFNPNANMAQPYAIPMDVALAPAAYPPAVSVPSSPPAITNTVNTTNLNPDTTSTTLGMLASASIKQLTIKDGTTYEQKFHTLSMLEKHTSDELDRSCIDAGIPDNYCVCHQFQPMQTNRLDVLGAAYYLVYVHLESRLRNHQKLCHQLDLEKVHQAEVFDFEQTALIKSKTSRRRRQTDDQSTRKPSSVRTVIREEDDEDKADSMPKREYSVILSTKPGGGLFQEVVRYYGKNMTDCEQAVREASRLVGDKRAHFIERQKSVVTMNAVCKFSIHSDSISRFNLYKNQSKCVKSNIELKKICYCNDLL